MPRRSNSGSTASGASATPASVASGVRIVSRLNSTWPTMRSSATATRDRTTDPSSCNSLTRLASSSPRNARGQHLAHGRRIVADFAPDQHQSVASATALRSSSAGMLHPVTSSATGPSRPIGRCFTSLISAAVVAAPDGSATVCSWSASRPTAATIASSVTRRMSSTSARMRATFSATGVRVARPSAIVSALSVGVTTPVRHDCQYRRRAGGLHTNDPHGRLQLLRAGGNATHERGITDGNVNRGDLRAILEDLVGNRSGADGDVVIGCVVEEQRTGAPRVFVSELERLREVLALLDDGGALTGDVRALDQIGTSGQKNRRAHAEQSRRVGNRGAVVAGARRHHLLHPSTSQIDRQRVDRTPHFERTGRQIGFQLQSNGDPCRFAERVGLDETGTGQIAGQELPDRRGSRQCDVIATIEISAVTSPANCQRVIRSLRISQASSTVPAGYNEESTAATSSRPACAAMTRKALPPASNTPAMVTGRRACRGRPDGLSVQATRSPAGLQRCDAGGDERPEDGGAARPADDHDEEAEAEAGDDRQSEPADFNRVVAGAGNQPDGDERQQEAAERQLVAAGRRRWHRRSAGTAALSMPEIGAATPMRPSASARYSARRPMAPASTGHATPDQIDDGRNRFSRGCGQREKPDRADQLGADDDFVSARALRRDAAAEVPRAPGGR